MSPFIHFLGLGCLGYENSYKNIRSSSQSGWPLRKIHISNDSGSFTFYVDIFLSRLVPNLTVYTITRWMSYKKQELLALREHLGLSLVFGGTHVAHLISFLCCVICFVLFVVVLCLLYPMLPVSLDCPFGFL